ncbi:MAG: ATP-binding protein, partial [Thermodesulfobacteriota bacterium]|nr:ATP-binding protein [Thermodesulfobacteriota bacterium]
ETCDTLVESGHYNHAWIATMDESGFLSKTAESGLKREFSSMINQLTSRSSINCVEKALMQSEIILIEKPSLTCMNCPLSSVYKGMGTMTIQIQHAGKIYGILSVSMPSHLVADDEEQNFFKEIANDLAFAMYRIELENQRVCREKAKEQQIEEFFAIFNALEGPVYVTDIDTYEILAVNRYCEEHYGPGLVGKICYQKLQDNQSGPCPFCTNHLLIGTDGTPNPPIVWDFQNTRTGNWYHCVDRAIEWPTGRLVRMEIATNITKCKLSEQALLKNEHELNERITELNCLYTITRVVEKWGISLEGILQEIVDAIPTAWQCSEIICAQITLEGQEFRTSNFCETDWSQSRDIILHGRPYGTLEVFSLNKRPEIDEGPFQREKRELIDAIAMRLGRIIEHKRAEETVQRSEERFRDLVENSLAGTLIIQDNLIIYSNPEQEKLFGPFPIPFRITGSLNIHPDDIEKVVQSYQSMIAGESQAASTEFRLYQMDEMNVEHHMKWVYCRASVIEYEGREAILVNMMDITRIRELEHLLRIQDKMASLGHVASGIAHEIRNPLSGINIYLSTLERMLERGVSSEKTKEIIRQIKSASAKIESIVIRVMDFSKPSEPHFVLIDINESIEEAINLSSVTLRKKGIKIEKVLGENLPFCHVDPNMIEEVVLNLITNAIEAIGNSDGVKRIRINSSATDNHILVRVSDSGHGVPPNLRDKIFDPFYTTKDGSTGIGLNISHRIVSDHGGRISVVTSEWGGAEFVIEIPLEKRRYRR